MPTVRSLAAVVALVASGALGCGGVQRAIVTAPLALDVAPPPDAVDAPPAVDPTRHVLVHAGGSSVEVTSGTIFGSFDSRITRFRGRLAVDARDPRRGRVTIDFDMTSFVNASRMITAILQYEFLEIDAYPQARFVGTFEPADGDERVVRGVLDLHGVRRGVAFRARIEGEPNGAYRFTTTFDLDRRPFGIRQHDEWDWVNRNDFRVRLDLRGTPETVTVEPD